MRDRGIVAFTDDLTVKDSHGADRHFSLHTARAGEFERPPHKPFVHGRI